MFAGPIINLKSYRSKQEKAQLWVPGEGSRHSRRGPASRPLMLADTLYAAVVELPEMTEFPDLFAGFNDALGRVGSVARRLGVD